MHAIARSLFVPLGRAAAVAFVAGAALSISVGISGCGPAVVDDGRDLINADDDDTIENPGHALDDPTIPGDDTPGDDTPGDDTPGDDTPGDDTPGDDVPGDCPVGVVCVDALPFTASGDTSDGADVFNHYACAPDKNESGRELVYRVAVPGPGSFAVHLDDALEDAGTTDVDVHILSAEDPEQCLARNDRGAAVSVTAGFVWVVLDSYVRADGTEGTGAFSAAFTFTPASNDGGSDALVAAGVPADVAALAIRAYNNARAQDLTDSSVFTVVDYALPSYEERMWTVDLASGEVLLHARVSHGSGSNSANDPAMASHFGNTSGSNMSSLGLVRTAETYEGHNGYSLRLDGLEASNDNMRDRLVVMHGAAYAEDSFVEQNGYLGRSNGCLAVAMSRSASMIDVVKGGTLIFDYYPDANWIASSEFLQ